MRKVAIEGDARQIASTAEDSANSRSSFALKIQRQGCSNEVLQRGLVDLVALVDVDGAPDFPIKAGVEQA